MKSVFTQHVLVRRIALALAGLSAVAGLPLAHAATSNSLQVTFGNDAKTVSYQFNYELINATSAGRQVFFDTDLKSTTGYSKGGIGAEFSVINGVLYKYSGKGGSDWAWTPLKNVSYTDDGKQANWTVALADLSVNGGTPPTTINILGTISGVITSSKATQILTTPAALPRDPKLWPFASNSIWNMPIGSEAQYVQSHLVKVPGNDPWAPMSSADLERIVLTPNAPVTQVKYSNAGWSGKDRCAPTNNTVLDTILLPTDFVVPNSMLNNGAVFMREDARTLVQTQPFTRCTAGGDATSLVMFTPVDLHGNGITGGHGGSNLSTLGGTMRVGELRPLPQGTDPYSTGMRHALKLNVDSREALYACTTKADCYTWPAQTADSAAVGYYGSKPAPVAAPKEMKMGALLAIPANVDISKLGLKTEPARQLAWTLQNYGTYIVDSTGGSGYAWSVEEGTNGAFVTQFKDDWGFDFVQRARDNTDWVQDLQTLITSLQVVANNGPSSIGGGGTPRQPLAPPLPM